MVNVNASPVLVWSFIALALLVAAAFVAAVYRSASAAGAPRRARTTVVAGVATAAWLLLTLGLAASGRLSFTSRPPTMGIFLATVLIIAVAIGTSRLGHRLATGVPLAALVGAQAFRFPLELLLHRAYQEGLMPVQMSYSGLNYDILSGLSAIVVALVLVRAPNSLAIVRAWNVAGTLLLANILVIALLSTPTPLRVFENEPANDWITHAPWVWLPAVFVLAAIVGHIVVYRRLRHEARAGDGAAIAAAASALGSTSR
jgi:hypothetical protein